VTALEAELDALFALSPEAMVEARNELAARLRKAGDSENAARIKALKRPTLSAWLLNQLFFHEPEQLRQAVEQAERVRALHAQDNVDRVALRNAAAEQQARITHLVQKGISYAEAAGLPHGLAQQRKLLATIQGWLSGAGDEPPGRMTRDLEPSGFAAVQSVGKTSDLPSESGTSSASFAPSRAQKLRNAPDVRLVERARAEVDARARRVQAAKALLERAEASEQSAEAESKRVERELREAERAVLALQSQQRALRERLEAARAQHGEARSAHEDSLKRLAEAELALHTLTRAP
jgi:hypothetical protein